MVKLAVNIDHVATIRQARQTVEPDPVAAAIAVEQAGAHGLVMHLRKDRRHIQERDIRLSMQIIRIPLNLEMAATNQMIDLALQLKPKTVTLVPENTEEITTEGGLNAKNNITFYQESVKKLKHIIEEVSLFIDPDPAQIEASAIIGADSIELHTGEYADSKCEKSQSKALNQLVKASIAASDHGLNVRAGHGLTYINATNVAAIPNVFELSIGHSIVSRAVFTGLDQAVKDMLNLIQTIEG